jgi:CYTH domain-containing protein
MRLTTLSLVGCGARPVAGADTGWNRRWPLPHARGLLDHPDWPASERQRAALPGDSAGGAFNFNQEWPMGVEIERKFLVRDRGILTGLQGQRLVQGYLSHTPRATVRLRLQGERAWLTLKGENRGAWRREFEYPLPIDDARIMLDEMCPGGVIDKTRYRVPDQHRVWEVDVFHGDNQGLIVAELELTREDESFPRPAWLGEEVTADPRYYNSALSQTPYVLW